MALDAHLSQSAIHRDRPHIDVDWAPAYELVLSLSCFLTQGHKASGMELGQAWVQTVQGQLPPEAAARFARKAVARAFKHNDFDLVLLLIHGCPEPRDAHAFLGWFAQLSAGEAYEAIAPIAPEPGPRLPRDFVGWRDAVLDMLGVWHAAYFRHVDPKILSGLADAADSLRARVGTCSSQELIEEVTNGIVIDEAAGMQHVILVPQYHHRPYNNHSEIQSGVLLLYPRDPIAQIADQPAPRLVRLVHALSDESRLRILRFLANGPCSLTEVARFAGLSQPTVHHHLTQLRAAGLVRCYFVNTNPNRYSLRPNAVEQLSQLLGMYLFSSSPQTEGVTDALSGRNGEVAV